MQDLRRIKQEGPRLEDVTQHWPFSFKRDNGKTLNVSFWTAIGMLESCITRAQQLRQLWTCRVYSP